MTTEERVAAELATIEEPRRGRRGWWVLGREHSSRAKAEAHRLMVARHRVEVAELAERQAAQRTAMYAEQGMHPATTSKLQPGDTYSIPSLRPPFRYYEYVVASVEALATGAYLVRHEAGGNGESCLLHTSDTDLFRRPAGE